MPPIWINEDGQRAQTRLLDARRRQQVRSLRLLLVDAEVLQRDLVRFGTSCGGHRVRDGRVALVEYLNHPQAGVRIVPTGQRVFRHDCSSSRLPKQSFSTSMVGRRGEASQGKDLPERSLE